MSTLYLDADYSQRQRPDQITLADILDRECRRKSIDFEVTDLNSQGWGDCMWMSDLNGVYSGEIKGAGEILGGLDHLEGQLFAQVQNCDHPFVAIRDRIESSADGNCYAFSIMDERQQWERHPDSGVTRNYKRRYFKQNYLGFRAKLARFYSEFGIEVYELPDLDSLATQLIALHSISNSEGRTFTRLIQEKFYIDEVQQARRDFMLTLMGIQGAGIHEETADAIATWMEPLASMSLVNFIGCLKLYVDKSELHNLAAQPMRNSLKPGARKRTIGPAKVAQIMKAVGL